MILKCPTDCEHEYDFPHSVITKFRTVEVNKTLIQVIYQFVVCRSCGHWINRQVRYCDCPFGCHEYLGGLLIARTPLDAVE